MLICTLSSGSKGNCIYVSNKNTSILIDDGLSFKELKLRASLAGIDISSVNALLITHEHTDHVKGVGVLSRAFNLPVYVPDLCYQNFNANIGEINYMGENKNYESGFKIGDFNIKPFRTPHDSAYSVGYKLSCDEKSVCIATDLGKITDGVFTHLLGSDVIVLESNHDLNMLKNGDYSYLLKKRILSNSGHLSNVDASANVGLLCEGGTKKFVLAHLSEDNNTPELAYAEAKKALAKIGAEIGGDITVDVASQYEPSRIIEF